MHKIEYFCDHCGKLLNENNGALDVEINVGQGAYVTVDLCEECIVELNNYIDKFIHNIEN